MSKSKSILERIKEAVAFDLPEDGSHSCTLHSIERSRAATGTWAIEVHWKVESGTSQGCFIFDKFWVNDKCLGRWTTFLKFLSGGLDEDAYEKILNESLSENLFPTGISSHRTDEPSAKPGSLSNFYFAFVGMPATITGKRESYTFENGGSTESFNVAFAGWKLDQSKVKDWTETNLGRLEMAEKSEA